MEFDPSKRSTKRIKDAIHVDKANSQWIAKESIRIIFPKRYINDKLGSLDSKFNVLAVFAVMLDDGTYDVCNVCSVMPLTSESSTIIKINGVDYYELSWSKGMVICPNTNLVLVATLAFEIYDEFIAKTRIPPYMDNIDHSTIFDTLTDFTGVKLGANAAVLKIYNATTTRSVKDRTRAAREDYKVQADFWGMDVDRIPLRSVAYGADNTTARLLGSYLSEGVNSALVNHTETSESTEQILLS